MPETPSEFTLTLAPRGRFDVIDVGRRVDEQFGDLRRRYRRTLYCSLHTTAGFLAPSLAARMAHRGDKLTHFFEAFRGLFPPDGDYQHDQLHLREDLTDEQREVEPRNGDSHLTFIGAGMRNCVIYRNEPPGPVHFIDLDGESDGTVRRRTASVLAYDSEAVVERKTLHVPLSRHPIDSINLADPRLGVLDEIDELLRRAGVEKARVEICLHPDEREVGLTVNEYETLLMRHDLAEVLRNPLKFAAQKGLHMLADPRSVPGKTLNYAKYDVVRVLNSLMEALHVSESVVERVVARLMAVPARRLLRSRRVSFLASDQRGEGQARLVRGRYQSPILVQWRCAAGATRRIQVRLVRLS